MGSFLLAIVRQAAFIYNLIGILNADLMKIIDGKDNCAYRQLLKPKGYKRSLKKIILKLLKILLHEKNLSFVIHIYW